MDSKKSPEEELDPSSTGQPGEQQDHADQENPVGKQEHAFEQPAEDQDPDKVETDQFTTD